MMAINEVENVLEAGMLVCLFIPLPFLSIRVRSGKMDGVPVRLLLGMLVGYSLGFARAVYKVPEDGKDGTTFLLLLYVASIAMLIFVLGQVFWLRRAGSSSLLPHAVDLLGASKMTRVQYKHDAMHARKTSSSVSLIELGNITVESPRDDWGSKPSSRSRINKNRLAVGSVFADESAKCPVDIELGIGGVEAKEVIPTTSTETLVLGALPEYVSPNPSTVVSPASSVASSESETVLLSPVLSEMSSALDEDSVGDPGSPTKPRAVSHLTRSSEGSEKWRALAESGKWHVGRIVQSDDDEGELCKNIALALKDVRSDPRWGKSQTFDQIMVTPPTATGSGAECTPLTDRYLTPAVQLSFSRSAPAI